MTVVLKIKSGETTFTLDLAPVGSIPGWKKILFFKINNGSWLTVCHNDPCTRELTLDYVEEKGNKCPECSDFTYQKTVFFKKLLRSMMGNPSDYRIDKITKLSKEGKEVITC